MHSKCQLLASLKQMQPEPSPQAGSQTQCGSKEREVSIWVCSSAPTVHPQIIGLPSLGLLWPWETRIPPCLPACLLPTWRVWSSKRPALITLRKLSVLQMASLSPLTAGTKDQRLQLEASPRVGNRWGGDCTAGRALLTCLLPSPECPLSARHCESSRPRPPEAQNFLFRMWGGIWPRGPTHSLGLSGWKLEAEPDPSLLST